MSTAPHVEHRVPGFSLRDCVKACVFAVCVVIVSPPIIVTWLEKRLSRSELLFVSLSQSLAVIPAFPGTWLRAAFYWGALEHCSWQVHVGFGSVFSHRGASMGRRASIGAYCVIGHADLGEEVMVGSRVSIPSGKRQHLDDEGRLSSETPRFDRVRVGAHAWIGEGAILLADVGAGSIVSAGAVVIERMPEGVLIGGNPARVIRPMDRASAASPGV